VRGAFHLLDGVDGGQGYDGSAVLDDGVDGALNGGDVDERAHGVVDEDDVVFGAGQRGEAAADGFLTRVSADEDVDAGGEAEVGDEFVGVVHFIGANADVDGVDAANRSEGAQAVDEERQAGEHEELLGGRA